MGFQISESKLTPSEIASWVEASGTLPTREDEE